MKVLKVLEPARLAPTGANRQAFQLVEPITFTPLGCRADEPRAKKRKGLDELVRYERG